MIRFCACTKGSASPPENPEPRESSKSCKSCGGKLPVDGRGAQSGSMLSTIGLELSRVIDPHLTWKTAKNGRQRAVRKARTSFTRANRKKSTDKSSNESEDFTDKDSKSTGDMLVSESEKLGVSILGRRFSNTLGSVPIKKRRFLLVRSPSPPHDSSSHSDGSELILESEPARYQDPALNAKQHPHDINSGCGMGFGQERNFADEKTDLEEVNEKICDAADFSGISILAAAACNSNMGGDFRNAEGSISKGFSSEGQGVPGKSVKLHLLSEEKEELLSHTSEGLVGRTGLPLEISASSVLPCKESNEIKSDESYNLEKSVNSLQNFPNKTTTESSSRDVRLHWDLNTVMDVWESHDDEVLNSEEHAANIVGEDGDHDKKLGNLELCQGQVGCGDSKNVSELVDSRVHLSGERKGICALAEIKMEEKPVVCSYHSTAGDNEIKHCFSLPRGDAPSLGERQLEVATIGMADVSEETKPSHNKDRSCSGSVSEDSGDFPSSVGAALVPVGDSSLFSAAAVKEEKTEACCISFSLEVETETSSSYLVSCENASVDRTTHACEPHHGADQGVVEEIYVENTYPASVADHDNCSADCCMTQMAQVTHIRSPEAEKHESLCNDSGTVKTDQQSLVSHFEKASDVLVDGNICENMVTAGAISGENEHIDALDDTDCDNNDKSKEWDVTPCVGDCETKAAEMKVDDNRCYELTDENLISTKTDFPTHNGSEVSRCYSTGMTPGNADAPLPDGALSSQGPCKSYTDGYASSPGQVALEDHLDCNYYSDASQNDAEQAIGMEKVEFLGDDDSQYEDGEFRESVVNCWLEDGAEEVETERVDYGSDRETDIYEAASDLPASVNLHVNNGGLSDASHDLQYTAQVGKDTQDAVSQPFLNRPLIADISDAGAGKRSVGSITENGLRGHVRIKDGCKRLVRDLKDASEFGAGNDKVIGGNRFLNEGDDASESSHSANFRMKMSGWDQLPGGCRSSGNGATDCRVGSISRNYNDASLDPSGAGESVRRVVGSSLRRDLSSRIERAHSSDGSRRKDKSYVGASRSSDHNDFNSRVERDTDAPRSIGRSGSSLHLQGRGRGNHWVDFPNHHGNNRHDSSGYYGPASFTQSGSRNAAAAAVAKVESNGFVVAPDGTIVKAGGVGPAGHLARRSAKASSQSTHCSHMGRVSPIERDGTFGMPPGLGHSREMSPDRPMFIGRGRAGKFGPGMVSIGHRERYRGPMLDDIIDSSSSMHHPISRRDHSFSPHRRPLHLSRSHSRSPSRSRTRSPPRWASPRGRNDCGMNSGAGLRLRSRSPPNFKSEARMQRPRPGIGEHIVSYAPSSRNHTSPPHSSRWIDGRKELPDRFREDEYKRCSGRSPPATVFSRGHRFDPMDSPGRLKPDEYHRPMKAGRFPEFVGFGRGSRHYGTGDDRRGHGDRYEIPYSGRQYDNDGNMKRFRYDIEDGFRTRIPRPRSSEFQRGESPRAFDRGIERQLGDSPQRAKEEKCHYRHGKDGKHNASFKSFGVRDGDNIDIRRRPS